MDNVGISLYDFMEALEADTAPQIADRVDIAGCAMFEIVTLREVPGRTYDAAAEVEQHLAIAADGAVRFRANTYHKGPGQHGIGRVEDANIPRGTVQEISRLLDTWLYMRASQDWMQPEDIGKWYLRVRFADGREQLQRGSLDGAFMDGIDIGQFMRERIPIAGLYLFDQDL